MLETPFVHGEIVSWKVSPSVIKVDNKFAFRVELTFYDGHTITRQHGGYQKASECNKEKEKTIAQLYHHEYVVHSKVRVKDFYSYWLNVEMTENHKITDNTYTSYLNCIEKYILPAFGKSYLGSINRGMLTKFFKSIPYASIVQLTWTVIKTSFHFAKENHLLQLNPTSEFVIPRDDLKSQTYHTLVIDKGKTLTLEQAVCLLEASRQTPVFMQVLFALTLGMRSSEIIGLKFSDVNYQNKTIHVQRQLGTDRLKDPSCIQSGMLTKQERHLKTFSSDRYIMLPEFVMDEIVLARLRYEKHRSRRKTVFMDLDYICCSSYGNPRSKGYCYPHFKALLEECGLPNIRWHDLRHTYATILMENEMSLKAISRILGHSKELITANVYINKSQIIADGTEAVERFLEGVMPTPINTVVDIWNCSIQKE